MISQVFYTDSRRYAFQRVGNHWRIYDGIEGDFLVELRSFELMCIWIKERDTKSDDGERRFGIKKEG